MADEALNVKIVTRERLLELVSEWRRKGDRIAFTNGVFDLGPHPGHIYSLTEARKLADRLVVGVNSDSSARMLKKGAGRPRLDERRRAANIAALKVVDLVVIFSEPTPKELLSALKPDYLVKGDDYRIENVAGREFAGEVRLIPRLEGYSTTSMDEERQRKKRNG